MSYLINGVINDWSKVNLNRKQVRMGLSIDSMQQQAILVGTHSLSLTLRECLSHKKLYAQYLSSELSRISIRPYCLTISIYFITHFGISKVLFFYGIINNLG